MIMFLRIIQHIKKQKQKNGTDKTVYHKLCRPLLSDLLTSSQGYELLLIKENSIKQVL